MMKFLTWSEQMDTLLLDLHEKQKIFTWARIASKITSTLGLVVEGEDCRIRYLQLRPALVKGEWCPEEEKQLVRLHDIHGNSWTKIAIELIGRNENNVKNHLYSKMRKSLRALNNAVKTYLRKQSKEVSETVIYKITEAIDEKIRNEENPDSKLNELCLDLKNRLINYQGVRKQVDFSKIDFQIQKNLIRDLIDFNKNFKKTPKKQRITKLGSINLKKGRETKKMKALLKKQEQNLPRINPENSMEDRTSRRTYAKKILPQISEEQEVVASCEIKKGEESKANAKVNASHKSEKSQFENFLEEGTNRKKSEHVEDVENMLRAEGILEKMNYSELKLSHKPSFSVRSQSSNLADMLGDSRQMIGEDFIFHGFGSLGEVYESCNQIFNITQE